MGVWTATVILPALAVVHAAGGAPLSLPAAGSDVALLLGNGCLDAVFMAGLLVGILVTSPFFIAMASMLVAPASILTDRVIHGTSFGVGAWLGTVAVLTGLALLQWDLPSRACARPRALPCAPASTRPA
jgi:hypothetical protein